MHQRAQKGGGRGCQGASAGRHAGRMRAGAGRPPGQHARLPRIQRLLHRRRQVGIEPLAGGALVRDGVQVGGDGDGRRTRLGRAHHRGATLCRRRRAAPLPPAGGGAWGRRPRRRRAAPPRCGHNSCTSGGEGGALGRSGEAASSGHGGGGGGGAARLHACLREHRSSDRSGTATLAAAGACAGLS